MCIPTCKYQTLKSYESPLSSPNTKNNPKYPHHPQSKEDVGCVVSLKVPSSGWSLSQNQTRKTTIPTRVWLVSVTKTNQQKAKRNRFPVGSCPVTKPNQQPTGTTKPNGKQKRKKSNRRRSPPKKEQIPIKPPSPELPPAARRAESTGSWGPKARYVPRSRSPAAAPCRRPGTYAPAHGWPGRLCSFHVFRLEPPTWILVLLLKSQEDPPPPKERRKKEKQHTPMD